MLLQLVESPSRINQSFFKPLSPAMSLPWLITLSGVHCGSFVYMSGVVDGLDSLWLVLSSSVLD